ncbi:MAG: hypothetical protein QOI03_2323 [Solirubrobacteraceae bacterium]|jgi:hypothetical protein|nr:hypothetical protein [Solirubrobacteraceae bacterium]
MNMRQRPRDAGSRARSFPGRPLAAALTAAALGAAAAGLVSCGSSAKLIPAADAGPLQSDFEAVAQAAATGNGSCTATETALVKTERDFVALPTSVDAGLHSTLQKGISNLRARALSLCAQPLAQTTTTSTAPKTTSTSDTTTATSTDTTPTTSTETTAATSTPAPSPSGPGGGTPAPKEGEAPAGGGTGAGEGDGGGQGGGK